jgi:hypothetical protein
MMKSGLTLLHELAAKALAASSSTYLSIVFVCTFALAGSAMVGFFLGIAPPHIHDEFSYLLAADTFAHGRLTNPTHPMWVHFETLHVIHQPSYMSKFMPAQGAVLWLGRILGGHPIVGVWLSMAFMCGAICWMLQAWLPPRWALLGGLFAVIHPTIGIGDYWAQSYWGGALPAAAGALLVGGVRKLMDMPRTGYSITAGLGLALLANSRPYEGLVVSIPVGLGLLAWMLGKNRPPPSIVIRNILLPFALIGLLSAGVMAYYNYRISGNVAQIPYLLHKEHYMMSALFVWQKSPPRPVYHHKAIEDFHTQFEYPPYLEKRTLKGFVKINFAAFSHYFIAVGSVFAISLIGSAKPLVSWAWKDQWGRFALFVYGFFILGMMLEIYSYLHYWAPITALNYLFIVQGLRLWRGRSPLVGQFILFGGSNPSANRFGYDDLLCSCDTWRERAGLAGSAIVKTTKPRRKPAFGHSQIWAAPFVFS